MCQRSTCSVRGIFVDIRRGTLEERYHTSYHVRKLKKWQWLIVSMRHLVEISEENRSLCLWKGVKFQTWRSQDVSKETLSDLVRKNVAQFSDKFFHFQYAAWKMCKGALNNHLMLKLHFLKSAPTLSQCIVKTSPISIMQLIRKANHIFHRRIAQKSG